MTDAVSVFPPGYRLTDSTTGAPMSGAVIRFYDAGTTTPKTVYSDATLETALGTSVTCDSLGYPTSNGVTKTLIYVGTADYKLTIETSAAVVIATHDGIKGAVETVEASDASVISTTPVLTKSLDYTVLSADQSSLFRVNCSSADVTLTLPSAVTVGDGWRIHQQHAGSANQAIVATVSSQTLTEGSKSYGTSATLALNGESWTLVSDGGNWIITDHTQPFFKPSQGVITIADRLATPPGSPVQGAAYIVTSSPTGAWSAYAGHDIAFYGGASWINFTPPSDCGCLAYVQDEDIYYRFVGTEWVAETGTTATAGTVRLADAAAMEAQTASRGVTADLFHRSPAAAKSWVAFNGAGTAQINGDFGVTSLTDNGTGDYTFTLDTAFSGATTYNHVTGSSTNVTVGSYSLQQYEASSPTTTAMRFRNQLGDDDGTRDLVRGGVTWFGDQ